MIIRSVISYVIIKVKLALNIYRSTYYLEMIARMACGNTEELRRLY